MSIGWFGAGSLRVEHIPTKRSRIAPPWLKSHFISTMHSLSLRGIAVEPGSRVALLAFEAYATFSLNPSDLIARAALSQSPESMAEALIEEAAQ